MKLLYFSIALVGAALLMPAADSDEAFSPVPYPEGFRRWTHLHTRYLAAKHTALGKAGCEKPCTGGLMHFYANEKAIEGFRTGKFPDGSIIADETVEVHMAEGGMAAPLGPRHGVGVMVKDAKKYATTGGWGYAAYKAGGTTDILSAKEKQACFQCHVPRKDHDYVFTEYKD